MINLINLLKDAAVKSCTEKILRRGYNAYKIPKDVSDKIVGAIINSTTTEQSLKQINDIPEFQDKNGSFWKGRKKYENDEARQKFVMNLINKNIKGPKVTEIGCSSDKLLSLICNLETVDECVGTDVHLPNLESNNEKITLKLQQDTLDIPIENNSMDTILLIDMIHHVALNDQKKLLNIVQHKLNNSGKLIIVEYTFSESAKPLNGYEPEEFKKLDTNQKYKFMTLLDWIGNILLQKRDIPMPYSFRTKEEWDQLFISIGYECELSEYIGFPRTFFHQGPYSLFVLKKKERSWWYKNNHILYQAVQLQ